MTPTPLNLPHGLTWDELDLDDEYRTDAANDLLTWTATSLRALKLLGIVSWEREVMIFAHASALHLKLIAGDYYIDIAPQQLYLACINTALSWDVD